MGEHGLGRWAAKGPMGAYDKVLRAKGVRFGRVLGAYPALSIWAIMIFYAIVTGWVVHYVVSSMTGAFLHVFVAVAPVAVARIRVEGDHADS